MQPEYFSRLSEPVKQFVLEVEQGAQINIEVVPDPKLNAIGPTGQGKLAITIESHYVRLFVPTTDYLPDGAVRHEMLHVKRFHIDGAPKLVLAEEENFDKRFSDALTDLDNAIEHIVIVPEELKFHPERRLHWEAVMKNVCGDLSTIPEEERALACSLHWAFLQFSLPNSPQIEVLRNFLIFHGIFDNAVDFSNKFLALVPNKEDMLSFFFAKFPEIPKTRIAMEYINAVTGVCHKPIP